MQNELQKGGEAIAIHILGVNGVGYDSGNKTICAGRSIPWLQDEGDVDAWGLWDVTYRDVMLLDTENHLVGVYNLTEHDLGNPDNYAALRQLLMDVASGVTRTAP